MKLILGSASERRKELLERISDDFNIIVSGFDESKVDFCGDCGTYVIELAKGKAESVADTIEYDAIVIGCDTVVTLDGKVLGKPENEEEAVKMLKDLSGKKHEVYSGLAVVDTLNKKVVTEFVCTEVLFDDLIEEDILEYVKSGDPMDKAGAYGIQGKAGTFVKEINGCFYNVVGLPINRLKNILRDIRA